jgi:hypothetical protein
MYDKPFHKRIASKLPMMLFMAAAIALSAISCKKKFPCSPSNASVNRDIILDNFLDNCFTTVNGTEHIRYRGKLMIQYLDGCTSRREEFSSVDFTSPSTSQKQPITITARVPQTGAYWIEVDIQGEQCARCASRWGGTNDNSTNNCFEMPVTGGLRVAYPRWQGLYKAETTTGSLRLNNIQHTFNVANSCGCVVPY